MARRTAVVTMALLASIFFFSSGSASAITVDLGAASDTYVAAQWGDGGYVNDGIDHSAEDDIVSGFYNTVSRALLRFDLSSIPSTATINSSSLILNAWMATGTVDTVSSYLIYKINRDWNEHTVNFVGSNGGADNIYYNPSWPLMINNNFYESTAMYSRTFGEGWSDATFDMTSLTNDWRAGNNYGLLIGPDATWSTIHFRSSEWPSFYNKSPILRVDYTDGGGSTVPEPCTMVLFGIGTAAMAFQRRRKEAKGGNLCQSMKFGKQGSL